MFLLLTLNQIPTWLLYFPFWLWTSKCRIWVSTFTVLFSVGCSIILNKLIFSMKIKIKSLTGVLWSFCFETFHIFWHIFSRYFFCKTSSGYYFCTAQKEFSIKDFFSKCDQIRRKLCFGHIYWRNPKLGTSVFVQCWERSISKGQWKKWNHKEEVIARYSE